MRPWIFFSSIFAFIVLITSCASSPPTPEFLSHTKIGVVVLHGKWGNADGKPTKPLISALEREGYLVSVPEMPWSGRRGYDKSYEEAMNEIDKAVSELKQKGVMQIFIAGHSMGANGAIGYAARKQVDGVMALAPGHVPDVTLNIYADDVTRAKKMVTEGKGNDQLSVTDFNQGKKKELSLTANNYLSYFDPNGAANMPNNASTMKTGTAFLWVVGTQDKMSERGSAYAFDKAPANTKSKYLVVKSDHFRTPEDAIPEILIWLAQFNT
jgi:esterase/lipase